MSLVILNVGHTGAGKSYHTKNKILAKVNLPKFIFDPQNEYKEYGSSAVNLLRQDFVNKAVDLKKSCILFEEARMFFKFNNIPDDLVKLMIGKRHTGNLIIFNFHALNQIPLDIFYYVNYINLFHTNDRADIIKTKFQDMPEIYEAFLRLKNSNIKYDYEVIKTMNQ
jgi:hypothetical protein